MIFVKKTLRAEIFKNLNNQRRGDEVCCDEVLVMRGAEVHGPRTSIFSSQKGLHT